MPSVRLNDVALRALQPPPKGQIDFWDAGLPGFGCRVSQGGAKTFLLKRDNRRITLGRYPVISLQDARVEAKRLLAEFTLGRLRPQSLPYSEAVKLFLAEKAKSARPRTIADYTRMLAVHFPFKGQLMDITHAQVAHRLERLKDTPAEHNHARTVGMIFFNWSKNRRYITDNPVVGISQYERKRRTRVLSDAELKAIWHACSQQLQYANTDDDQLAIPKNFAAIVQLMIVCGQRKGETAALQRAWIDLKNSIITLPDDITKNGNEHILPIGEFAVLCITPFLAKEDLLFPAANKPTKPFCGWGKAKETLDKLCGVTAWTLHDIRRTFRTNLGRLGVAPHIAERVVNHVSARSDMERTYDLHRYLPEMRDAIERWETHLTALLR